VARKPNYEKFPVVSVSDHADACAVGWDAIAARLREAVATPERDHFVLAVECYPGVFEDEIVGALTDRLRPAAVLRTRDAMLWPQRIDELVARDVTDDPVFGHLTQLQLADFIDRERQAAVRGLVARTGLTIVCGVGTHFVCEPDLVVYADLARWEAQMRFRRDQISNLGVENRSTKWSLQYKRAFFVDWRVADRHKKALLDTLDFLLDTNVPGEPKMIAAEVFHDALRQTARRPFRVVPFFDPAPWGGQWMKEVCDLDRAAPNYGWCFDCVPEENSLLLGFGEVRVEVPAIDLVFFQPRELLGDAVHARFGTEFPIRFDFLDTFGGGNLSLQVHPSTEYIQGHFGMHYTQDESYYMLDAGDDACVYLGVRDAIPIDRLRGRMWTELEAAQRDANTPFRAEKYVNKWPAKRHDHFLIPAGTVHCSGANSMVLEISATPYIFTFKMWDWGRLGLDGVPRPIHLAHALNNVQWDRGTEWTRSNLINRVEPLAEGDGWREERTGLHEREFIETRRHWFTKRVPHKSTGGVNVLNLVEGEEVIVESPTNAFPPLVVHYAETFIVPAAAGDYTISPHGPSAAGQCATMKAYVRT
jgi:mannose-6-phosphate isomerase class I